MCIAFWRVRHLRISPRLAVTRRWRCVRAPELRIAPKCRRPEHSRSADLHGQCKNCGASATADVEHALAQLSCCAFQHRRCQASERMILPLVLLAPRPSACHELYLPTLGAEQDAMRPCRPGDVVELGPDRPNLAQRREGFRHQMLVYFGDVEDRVVRIDGLEVVDDAPDRRPGPVEV